MKFFIYLTSDSRGQQTQPPCPEAKLELDHEPWPGADLDDHERFWSIEFENLEHLTAFVARNGRCILHPAGSKTSMFLEAKDNPSTNYPLLEIYDDRRE